MRITQLDGFRTIAVLGVLWAHNWMFLGTPALNVFGIDISGIFSGLATGVDLFFVISGFCMYLMYISKQQSFNLDVYINYLGKRFVRIAPAFYAAILVYAIVDAGFQMQQIDWQYIFLSAAFVRTYFSIKTAFAPHFWSLATEWQFYLVLPIMIGIGKKINFKKMIFLFVCIALVFRALVWIQNEDVNNIINYSLPNRIIEFINGIVIAKLYLSNKKRWFTHSSFMIVVGVAIAFAGRILMSTYFQDRQDIIGYISRVINIPILTAGYAIIVINTLNSKSIFSRFMGSTLMSFLGKFSYSMYLWHWLIAENISKLSMNYFHGNQVPTLLFSFILSILILIPISMLSYYLFESFYFKKKHFVINS
jgi:peptidoglycan/LPS O-acetylase OafA/YrhL